MKVELNCSHNCGGDAQLLQIVAIHLNQTVCKIPGENWLKIGYSVRGTRLNHPFFYFLRISGTNYRGGLR